MTDAEVDVGQISRREKLEALLSVATYRPLLTAGIISMSLVAALLEAIGLSFLIPVIEIAQGTESGDVSAIGQAFITVYEFLSVPFSLETVILGVVFLMAFGTSRVSQSPGRVQHSAQIISVISSPRPWRTPSTPKSATTTHKAPTKFSMPSSRRPSTPAT